MKKCLTSIFALVILGAAMVFVSPPTVTACEPFHDLIVKPPVPTPVVTGPKLCWSGCPLRIGNEQDTGKGRWIINKKSGRNSVQQLITFEYNTTTNIDYVKVMKRQTPVTPGAAQIECPTIPDPLVAERVALATDFPPCDVPNFKLKGVKPRVCANHTLNCPSKNQRSLMIFHNWDNVDDLGMGTSVVVDVQNDSGVEAPTTFRDSANATLNVWFEVCCGNVADFGAPGQYLETDTYAVIWDKQANNCFLEKLRESGRSRGSYLPDPATGPECKKKKK